MGMFKLIGIACVVIFVVATASLWFPEQTEEALKMAYELGIMFGKLAYGVGEKVVVSVIEFAK